MLYSDSRERGEEEEKDGGMIYRTRQLECEFEVCPEAYMLAVLLLADWLGETTESSKLISKFNRFTI